MPKIRTLFCLVHIKKCSFLTSCVFSNILCFCCPSAAVSDSMTEEDKLKRLTRERMRQEYYFAIKEEGKHTLSFCMIDLEMR